MAAPIPPVRSGGFREGCAVEEKVSGYEAGIPQMRTGMTFDLAAAGGSEDVRSA
jgi:hypothetical protein